MPFSLEKFIEDIKTSDVIAVEPLRSARGLRGISMTNGMKHWNISLRELSTDILVEISRALEENQVRVACFDYRMCMDFISPRTEFYDVKTIFGGSSSLPRLIRDVAPDASILDRLDGLQGRMQAASRAAKIAGIDLVRHSVSDTVFEEFLASYLKARVLAIYALFQRADAEQIIRFDSRRDFIVALHEIELSGIKIDEGYVASSLLRQHEQSDMKCFRSMSSLNKNGYLTSLYNAAGTKTGRLRIEGGFNSMGIPRGPCRNAVVSRFKDGSIYSFDYNAIDYRSIVSSIGGDFASLYSESADFHTRTAQFIFDDIDEIRREAMKMISYTSIYGGSLETLVQRTGLGIEKIRLVMQKLDPNIAPIHEFRERLWQKYQNEGFIEIPGVGWYNGKDEDMHPGKLLALYAQGYSAYIFERAFVDVHELLRKSGRGSCIIFPVHDELVVDVHPDDEASGIIRQIKSAMEHGVAEGFVVNFKKGRSYGEVV